MSNKREIRAIAGASPLRLPDDLKHVASMGAVGSFLVRQYGERVPVVASQRTAEALHYYTRVFGEVVGARETLDAESFNAFHAYLESSTYSPETKHSLYKHASGMARYLMQTGIVGHFRIPKRYPYGAVLAVTPAPRRLTDGADLAESGLSDSDILHKVVAAAYEELNVWRRKRAIATIISEAAAPAYRAILERLRLAWPNNSQVKMDLSWTEAILETYGPELQRLGYPVNRWHLASLAYCILFAREHYDGIPRTIGQVKRTPTQARVAGDARYAGMVTDIGMRYPAMFPSVLCPGQDEAAALAVLLAAAHVSADSAAAMKADCLKDTLESEHLCARVDQGQGRG